MTELLGILQGLQGLTLEQGPTLEQALGQLRGVCSNVKQSRGYASCWSTMLLFWSSLKSLSAACCSLSLLKLVCSALMDLLLLWPWLCRRVSWAPGIIRLHPFIDILPDKTPKLVCAKASSNVKSTICHQEAHGNLLCCRAGRQCACNGPSLSLWVHYLVRLGL